MSQSNSFDEAEEHTQFAWLSDGNLNSPVLIIEGSGNCFHIWNGYDDAWCDINEVKIFDNSEHHPFIKQLLLSSYKLFKEKQEVIEVVKKLKSKVEKKIENGNKELINRGLIFNDEQMKWFQINNNHGHTYCPVLIVQDIDNKPIIVMDMWGNYLHVRRRTELVEFPLTTGPTYVLSHLNKLKKICERYISGFSTIEIGTTRCQWHEKKKELYLFENTVTCQGTIINFISGHNHEYTVTVQRDDNGGYNIFNSNQIRVLQKKTAGQSDTEEKLQEWNLEVVTKLSILEKQNSKLLQEKKEQEQTVEEIEKEKQIIYDQHKALKAEKDKLDIKMNELSREQSDNEQLVTTLRERLLDTSVALDLSDGFPPVADIIKHFETIKTQFHHEASKTIKYSLKSQNKALTKVQYVEIASKLLFDILSQSYAEMNNLETQEIVKIADDHHEWKTNKVEKQLRQSYEDIINKVEKDKVENITSECIKQNELGDILTQDARKAILSYNMKCIEVCWEIVLSRDPKLTIEPLTFKSKEKIEFDDKMYEAGPRSEVDQYLNFIIWPAIFRTDTNHNLSLIIAVFLNDIPKLVNHKSDEMDIAKSDMEMEVFGHYNNDNGTDEYASHPPELPCNDEINVQK